MKNHRVKRDRDRPPPPPHPASKQTISMFPISIFTDLPHFGKHLRKQRLLPSQQNVSYQTQKHFCTFIWKQCLLVNLRTFNRYYHCILLHCTYTCKLRVNPLTNLVATVPKIHYFLVVMVHINILRTDSLHVHVT